MRSRDPGVWMWAEACELLERAERLHRQFFTPQRGRSRQPTWQPPVDMFETETGLWIVVALPGVAPKDVEVLSNGPALLVTGERRMPAQLRRALIHRLEIPHGRFERQIPLPAGSYEIHTRELSHGCLVLGLRKLGRVSP